MLAVRVQEMFGCTDTPRVAGGRQPVLLQLLSPAGRPVQVTADLAGFWAGSYREVQKGTARPLPEAPLAGGSASGKADSPDEKKLNVKKPSRI